MCDWIPSQEEQDIAAAYVLDRVLERPTTDFPKAFTCIALYCMVGFSLASCAYLVSDWLGIFLYAPDGLQKFALAHPNWFIFLYYLSFMELEFICLSRKAAIGMIKLYQHYADERIRRRCLFKPTCSEYAILAINKYGLIIGLFKTYIRLFKKCRGNIYRIDYP